MRPARVYENLGRFSRIPGRRGNNRALANQQFSALFDGQTDIFLTHELLGLGWRDRWGGWGWLAHWGSRT